MQWVILVGVWLSDARFCCCWVFLETRWQPSLSKFSPTFFLIPAISACTLTLSPVLLSLHILSSCFQVLLLHTSLIAKPFWCVHGFCSHSNVFYPRHTFGHTVWFLFLRLTFYPWCDMTSWSINCGCLLLNCVVLHFLISSLTVGMYWLWDNEGCYSY